MMHDISFFNKYYSVLVKCMCVCVLSDIRMLRHMLNAPGSPVKEGKKDVSSEPTDKVGFYTGFTFSVRTPICYSVDSMGHIYQVLADTKTGTPLA